VPSRKSILPLGFPLSRTSLTRSKLPKRNSRIFLVKSPRQDPKDLKVRHAFQSRSSNAWQPGRKAAAVTWSAVYITATRPATRIDTDASCTRRPVKRCRLISTGPRWAWAPWNTRSPCQPVRCRRALPRSTGWPRAETPRATGCSVRWRVPGQ